MPLPLHFIGSPLHEQLGLADNPRISIYAYIFIDSVYSKLGVALLFLRKRRDYALQAFPQDDIHVPIADFCLHVAVDICVL